MVCFLIVGVGGITMSGRSILGIRVGDGTVCCGISRRWVRFGLRWMVLKSAGGDIHATGEGTTGGVGD